MSSGRISSFSSSHPTLACWLVVDMDVGEIDLDRLCRTDSAAATYKIHISKNALKTTSLWILTFNTMSCPKNKSFVISKVTNFFAASNFLSNLKDWGEFNGKIHLRA